jgi:hypothetical protein
VLTEYQKGSLFGAIIVAAAFVFSFSTTPTNLYNVNTNQIATNITKVDRQDAPFWDRVFTHPTNLFTLGLLVVGSGQAILFLWQLSIIRNGLVDAKEASDAARQSAEVADKSLKLSSETAQRQLRAYIFIEGGVVRALKTNDGRSFLRVEFITKNSGQTPAYSFQSWARLEILDAAIEPRYDTPRMVDQQSFDTIGPGTTREAVLSKEITNDDFTRLGNRNQIVRVWGRYEYKDAFEAPRYFNFFLRNGQRTKSGDWPIEAAERHSEGN